MGKYTNFNQQKMQNTNCPECNCYPCVCELATINMRKVECCGQKCSCQYSCCKSCKTCDCCCLCCCDCCTGCKCDDCTCCKNKSGCACKCTCCKDCDCCCQVCCNCCGNCNCGDCLTCKKGKSTGLKCECSCKKNKCKKTTKKPQNDEDTIIKIQKGDLKVEISTSKVLKKTNCCTCCDSCQCNTCENPCTCKYPGIGRCCTGGKCKC